MSAEALNTNTKDGEEPENAAPPYCMVCFFRSGSAFQSHRAPDDRNKAEKCIFRTGGSYGEKEEISVTHRCGPEKSLQAKIMQ